MSIPNVSGALRGWTKKIPVIIIFQEIVDHKKVESESPAVKLEINLQPMPFEQIEKKPEEQRSWKWYSLWVRFGALLKTDDKIIIENVKYRIMKSGNWRDGGYQFYEVIEDYQ